MKPKIHIPGTTTKSYNSLMKRTFIPAWLAAMSLVLVQCAKVEVTEPQKPSVSGETVTLTVRSEAPLTKTSIDGETGQVFWSEGDYIIVNGESFEVTPDTDDPTVARVENVPASDSYLATYSMYFPTEDDPGILTVNFPSTQTYIENTFAQYTSPMIAYSETTDLELKNIGGVVKFGVSGTNTLKSLTFSSRDNEYLSGYLQIPLEDLMSGDLQNWSDFSPYYYNQPIITIDLGDGIALSTEPVDIYIVVPAKEYSSGFYITMEDDLGNVAVQGTSGAKTVNRSELLELPDFEFTPLQEITIEPGEATATTLSYTVTAAAGTAVRTAVIFNSLWEEYIEGPEYQGDADKLGVAILASGSLAFTGTDGSLSGTADQALNSSFNYGSLTASTDYKILVAYSDASEAKGKVTILDMSTAAPEGDAPEMEITENAAEYPYRQIEPVIKTTDAASIKFALVTKSIYDSYILEGYTDKDLVIEYGQEMEEEWLTMANDAGIPLTYNNLNENTAYVFIVMATGAGGMETVKTQIFTTEYYLDPSAEWTILTTDAEMDCGLFLKTGRFTVSGLTVEKMTGADIFRIETPFSPNKCPDLYATGNYMYTSDWESAYVTIDARNPASVILEKSANYIGVYDTEYEGEENAISLFSAMIQEVGHAAGTYDAETGVIEFGDICLQYGNLGYMRSDYTVLYLNPGSPVTGNGAKTESFTTGEVTAW